MTDHTLNVRTFGAFIIEREGQIVEDFLTLKTALLFTYLAMNTGEHSREKLSFLLWSETTDEQALKNLRTVLSSLRRTVPDAVNISRKMVQIIDNDLWVDARVFEDACNAIFAGEAYSLERMLSVADLYYGEFLCDLHLRQAQSLTGWIDHKRDELHQKYLQLLYHIVECCLENGEIYKSVEIARRLVLLNPLWEAAQRQLMLLLVYLDQTGEALIQYERVATMLDEELGVTPERETVALYQKIKSGEIHSHETQTVRIIVLPDLAYVAPQNDLNYLREMLDKPECRLVTITGIGGTGKTMLATFVAHERQNNYRDGVTIVPITPISDMQTLSRTILSSLNVSVTGVASAQQVVEAVQDKEMLLVLDNYEHLLPDTALISQILEEASGVEVLITSQLPLNLRHEWTLPLNGFEVDTSNTIDFDNNEAVKLFKKTAERILPQLDLTPYKQSVLDICRLLEGLPLGIVIAASQVKYLAPPEILSALRDDMLAMKSMYQDLPERHRGFGSLVNATLKHLSEEDQQALMALSIFRGSFDHAAALTVADINRQAFIRLVDQSLIQRVENFRYTIHGLLKRVFHEQLIKSDQKDIIRRRFTAHYQQWCHQIYRESHQMKYDLAYIEREHANIWHLDLLDDVEQQRYILEIMPALQQYWKNRGFGQQIVEVMSKAVNNPVHPRTLRGRGMAELALMMSAVGTMEETDALCEQAIATASDNLYVHVLALQVQYRTAMQRGEYQNAYAFLEKVLELEPQRPSSNDPQIDYRFVGNHIGMGLAALEMGQSPNARSHWEVAINGFKQLNEPLQGAQAQNNLALLDLREGNYEAASQHFQQVITIFETTEHDTLIMIAKANLAKALMLLEDFPTAYARLKEAMLIAVRIKRQSSILYQMETFTQLANMMKAYMIAAQLYGFILKRSEDVGIAFSHGTQDQIEAYSAHIQAELGDEDFDSYVTLGKKLSLDSAVALAFTLSSHM